MAWLVAALTFLTALESSCQSAGRIPISPAAPSAVSSSLPDVGPSTASLKPIPRYGGYVLTATGMPRDRYTAYLWAKNIGTLVAYETFLRKYPDGGYADFFRGEIRKRFIPTEEEWQSAWLLYSKMEIIDGVICDPEQGVILVGHQGNGRLAPFLYEDLITALKCALASETVGVTMSRVFPARNTTLENPADGPDGLAFETSVAFNSKILWNTHLAYILFEGDRALKTLSQGYDIFLGEPTRSKVPGFATVVEMAAQEPPGETGKYGRIWIELMSVKINTTEKKNVAMFSDVHLDVLAESKYDPPTRFAKHLQDHYAAYAEEFPIFGEVERSARTVAIAKWLAENYPEVAQKLVDTAYDNVKVFVPQVIPANSQLIDTPLYREWLTGGVVFPYVNKTTVAGDAKIAETSLDTMSAKVLQARGNNQAAWEVQFGPNNTDKYIAWRVSGMKPDKATPVVADNTPQIARGN